MPIYEYECKSCGHQFEQLNKISDPVVCECPKCHKSDAQRFVSAAGFQLKGSGWYVTDFKDKPKASEKNDKKVAENSVEASTSSNEKSTS